MKKLDMKLNNCKLLEDKMIFATVNLETEMRRIWPKGRTIMFTIRHGQYKPSRGVVIRHSASCLRVRMNTPGEKVIDVHYSKII